MATDEFTKITEFMLKPENQRLHEGGLSEPGSDRLTRERNAAMVFCSGIRNALSQGEVPAGEPTPLIVEWYAESTRKTFAALTFAGETWTISGSGWKDGKAFPVGSPTPVDLVFDAQNNTWFRPDQMEEVTLRVVRLMAERRDEVLKQLADHR